MDLKRYPLARSPVAAAATACQQLFRSYRARFIYRGRLVLALLAEDDSASVGSPAAPPAAMPTDPDASSTLPPPESPSAQAVRELESRVLAIADRAYAGRARRHREYVCAVLLQRSTRRALDRMVPVFEPESRLLTLWQLTIFAFVLVSAVVVPLMVAFEGEMPRGTRASLSTMDKVFDIAFIIDMLV